MTTAARITDLSGHGGAFAGPGVSNVLINGTPAAVAGEMHTCPVVAGVVPHAVTPLPVGSKTVLICGRPALRAGDLSSCGAPIVGGAANVLIGG